MHAASWERYRTLDAAGSDAAAGAVLPAGARIGPWEVLELLGSGGMSHVYLARRAEGEFEQRVALKLVRRNAQLIDRLRHERQVIAGLRHPHIVSLIDGGETAEGDLWLAMALVEGLPIDAYAAAGRLPWRARLALFDAVCAAVEYAHGRALIHRDIKPANILVDTHGHPRLLDFGIAVAQGSDEGSDRALTPGYASPEQIAGQPLTTATDVFQLGMVFRAVLEVAAADLRCPRTVRADLAALIARATAFAPEQRYPTVAALREDLANVLARRPLAQDRDSWRRRWLRFAERHRLPLAVAALAVLALAASLTLAALRLREERDLALANGARAQAIAKFLVDTLAQANPWGNQAGGGSVLAAVDRAAARLDGELGESADVRRELRATIANVYMNLDEARRCLALLGGALAADEIAAAPPLEQVRLLLLRSECHIALDDRDAAWQPLEQAEALLADQSGREAEQWQAWVLVDQGQILSLNGKLGEANARFERGLALAVSSGAREQEYRAHRMLGFNLQNTSDTESAVRHLQRAVEIASEVLGPTHRSTLTTASGLALTVARLGRVEEAERILSDTIAAAESVQMREGAPGIVIAQLRDNLAALRYQQGRFDECIREAQTALEIYRREAPASSSQGFNPSWRVAACAYQAGSHALAGEYAEVALGYAHNGVPVGLINAERMLAAVAARAGRLEQARTHLERSEQAFASTEVTNPTVLTALQLTRALVAWRGGDREAARRHLADADAGVAASGVNPGWLKQERAEVGALVETAPGG